MKYIYMSLILIVNVSIKIVHFSINVVLEGLLQMMKTCFPR